jgi:predicted helicase
LSTAVPTPRRRKTALPKLIEKYYADLLDLAQQNVMYEMGTRPAFFALLAAAGKENGWTLIAEHEKKVNGKTIRPDGTFKDEMNLVRGYWEAKDTADKLDAEIEKKRKAGYPLNNIIFEDTATAVLYQNGQRILTADMKDPAKLSELVVEFFRHIEPEIEEFEHAIDEFKERVPDLAEGLAKKIEKSHKDNAAFKKAFADFFELCRTSLNPNLSQSAVDEMLIQHILTERLIREIFDNPEFVRRNVIAAEVEKVMLAMTSQSFDRNTYLKELDRFYVAIERAARTMTDFSDKQHFLNTVYERFFQGYSVKLADTMGIVYTPQEIVDFMCASVADVLEKEFGKKLWSDDVYIIDPCTGTGNFIVNLIRRIPKAKLEEVYKNRLFANEIMLLPYYIAALNIEHAYFEQMGIYEGFEGLCFVDTLDLALGKQGQFEFLTQANTKRVERQKRAPINVIIGNPPYNVGQAVHNDSNRNREYSIVDSRIRETYSKDSNATSVSKLSDAYVKFFRWASDRLHQRDGIVCFVTNNSFVEQFAFDGMRKNLLRDFTAVYHLDLEGNVRHDPTLAGSAYNVFGIQVGVGITIAIRKSARTQRFLKYSKVEKLLRRGEKLAWLRTIGSMAGVEWDQLHPDARYTWLVPANAEEFAKLMPLASKEGRNAKKNNVQSLFKDYSLGVATHRDSIVYDFSAGTLTTRVEDFIDAYNGEVDRFKRAKSGTSIDTFVRYDKVVWDRDLKNDLKRGRYGEFAAGKVRMATYRPFSQRHLFFDRLLNAEVYGFPSVFPTSEAEGENLLICLTSLGSEKPFMALLTKNITDLHLVGAGAGTQCFPFYVYDEDGSNRRENVTDWALDQFRTHYKDKKIDKWAIFHYVYGLLHHPGYREKFADNLKRELPRIPFAPDFKAFADSGEKLATLHLDYEKQKEWELEFIETPGVPLSYRVEDKMRLSKDKTQLKVNPSLTLSGIPPEGFEYRLGNRSALDWVIDQYQVSTDKRSGITSDPNREEDPKYIVRLVGQVIRVSIETMKLVNSLPTEFS